LEYTSTALLTPSLLGCVLRFLSPALLKRELAFAAVAGVFYVYIAAARLLYA
jgi:hypothetical protein